MSNYKNKSELNLAAAELLHEQTYYPPVAHCSYYSCHQLMLHVWYYVLKRTEKELLATKTMNEGSHEILINQIAKLVHNKNFDFRSFNNNIGILKKLRVDSDYRDIEVNYSISSRSINICKDTLAIIKKCF